MIISVTHTVGHIIIMSQSHTRKASLTQPNTQGSLCVTLTNYAHSPGPWPPGSFISSLCLVSQLTRHISAQNVSSLFTVVRHHNHNQRASHSLSLTVTLDTVVCVDCPDSVGSRVSCRDLSIVDACDVGIDHFSIHISFTHSAASRVGASADMPHARAGARARTSDYGTLPTRASRTSPRDGVSRDTTHIYEHIYSCSCVCDMSCGCGVGRDPGRMTDQPISTARAGGKHLRRESEQRPPRLSARQSSVCMSMTMFVVPLAQSSDLSRQGRAVREA